MSGKILWCGGSHLGNAAPVIRRLHEQQLSDFEPHFYKTAAPENRDWSQRGGRYVVDGSVVSGNGAEPQRKVDLAKFDAVVFIGQWIQPQRAFGPVVQPLSRAVIELVAQESFRRPSRELGEIRWYNEPLSLFPKLAGGPVFLVPDPAPSSTMYRRVSVEHKRRFYEELQLFCDEVSIRLCPQPNETLRSQDLATRRIFSRPSKRGNAVDHLHMNETFWNLVLETALLPRLRPEVASRTS